MRAKRQPRAVFAPPRRRPFNEVLMWSDGNEFADDIKQKVEEDSYSPDTSTHNADTTDSNSTEESESDSSSGTSQRVCIIPFALLLSMAVLLVGAMVIFWHGQPQRESYSATTMDPSPHDHHFNLMVGLGEGSAGYGGRRAKKVDEDSYAPETADDTTTTTTSETEEDVEDVTTLTKLTSQKSIKTRVLTSKTSALPVLSLSKRSKRTKKQMTMAGSAATTIDSSVAVPVRPIIRRPVLCTIGRYARANTKYPEDGLCDFFFCPVTLQENFQFSSESDAIHGFRAQAKKSHKTQFGLDINVRKMNATLARLRTDHADAAFKSLWDDNLRQHGLFYPVLRHNSDTAYVNTIIQVLNTLRKLQLKFRTTDEVLPSHIFVGLALLLHGQNKYAAVKKHFTKIIGAAKPDVILLRTHYLKKDDGNLKCRITGPAVWQGGVSADQPTFLESLRFLRQAVIPNQVVVLLSFTEAMRWYRWDANDTTFTMGEKCAVDFHSDLVPRSKLCLNTASNKQAYTTKHKSTQQMVSALNKKSFGLVYDNKDTIRTKMCWASTSFKYPVGWAMFDLEFADTGNMCKDPVFTKGFPLVRWVKHYIKNGFHDASECEA